MRASHCCNALQCVRGNISSHCSYRIRLYGISSAVVSSATPATKASLQVAVSLVVEVYFAVQKRQAVPEAQTSSKVQKQQQVLPSKNQPATVNAYERRNPGQVDRYANEGNERGYARGKLNFVTVRAKPRRTTAPHSRYAGCSVSCCNHLATCAGPCFRPLRRGGCTIHARHSRGKGRA